MESGYGVDSYLSMMLTVTVVSEIGISRAGAGLGATRNSLSAGMISLNANSKIKVMILSYFCCSECNMQML